MNRRNALGALFSLVSLLFMPLVSMAAPKKRKLLIEFSASGPIASVHGDFEAKEAFHLAWQSLLWPDWKTSRFDHARTQYRRVLMSWKEGHDIHYWASKDQTGLGFSWCDAIMKASKLCGYECEIRHKAKTDATEVVAAITHRTVEQMT